MDLHGVYASRRARAHASLAALLVTGAGELLALVTKNPELATEMWLAGLAAGAAVLVIAYVAAWWMFDGVVERGVRRSLPRDTPAAVARSLEARAVVERAGRASLAVPFAAIALLGPLTLHLTVVGLYRLGGNIVTATDFGAWIAWSAVVVGHAHIVAAVLAVGAAYDIAASSREHGAMRRNGSFGKVWLGSVVASAIPGALLVALPPIIAAVTGIVLLGPMIVLRAWFLKERATVEQETRVVIEDVAGELTKVAENGGASDDVRTLAMSQLAELSPPAAIPVIDRCMRSRYSDVQERAFELCIALGHRPELEAVLGALPHVRSSIEVHAAELLSRYRDPRVEPALIAMLGSEEKTVKLAAIAALSYAGTVSSVEKLGALHHGSIGGKVARAARLAVLQIQDRLDVRAGRGQLTISEAGGAQGALSIEDGAGGVSVAE
jgi:hypothetical protein